MSTRETVQYYLDRMRTVSARHAALRMGHALGNGLSQLAGRVQNAVNSSFSTEQQIPEGPLRAYLKPLSLSAVKSHAERIKQIANYYCEHRFDLLGSGWVKVRHGMKCLGVEGHVYPTGRSVQADSQGNWLKGRINGSNLKHAKAIWRCVDEDYIPIDWHLDFRSGFRWPEKLWYAYIKYGHKAGVDVKVPWELSRMQHLPFLAYAYVLTSRAESGRDDFNNRTLASKPSLSYLREFRNQVLDFIATNPPRYGVNWSCTMDTAIRAANWLIAFDLFRAHSAVFDDTFERTFRGSIFDHGRHIINKLEFSADLKANHYLADIVGLLFIAAYLPRNQETDTWLAFSIQELIEAVGSQFLGDGANFEASTSYHRLCSEMVFYGTALVLGLPEEKREALKEYDHRLHKVGPPLNPGPMKMCLLDGREVPFPLWYLEKLKKMAEFTCDATRPDGQIVQIGDNDSGRFLKLWPAFDCLPVGEARKRFVNLASLNNMQDKETYWLANNLDHRHLLALERGLLPCEGSDSESWVDAEVVACLANGVSLSLPPTQRHGCNKKVRGSSPQSEGEKQNWRQGLRLVRYPDFGLYVFRSERVYLTVRCGQNGQNGRGGHAHNDQLSIELAIDGIPILVDPGSYCYTCLPEMRNRFRSTAMHNTLQLSGKEQNPLPSGSRGLFHLPDAAKPEVIKVCEDMFEGRHKGFGCYHRRLVQLLPDRLETVDEVLEPGSKTVFFHFSPYVDADYSQKADTVRIFHPHLRLKLSACSGSWVLSRDLYSPGYGLLMESTVARFESLESSIKWTISIDSDNLT